MTTEEAGDTLEARRAQRQALVAKIKAQMADSTESGADALYGGEFEAFMDLRFGPDTSDRDPNGPGDPSAVRFGSSASEREAISLASEYKGHPDPGTPVGGENVVPFRKK